MLSDSDDQAIARVAPLFGVIAGKSASALINNVSQGIAGGISEGAARKDTKYVTATDFNLYLTDLSDSPAARINPRFGYITVATGQFDPDAVDCSDEYIPREVLVESTELPRAEWQTSKTDNSVENFLRRANVCLVGKTKSVYEARTQFPDDRTAYRISNAGFWINSLTSTASSKATRNLLYALELFEPAKCNDGRVLFTAWANIGRVSAGDSSVSSALGDRSGWLRGARSDFEPASSRSY